MEPAKVTASGQVTIPLPIRKKLGIREGGNVIFMDEGDRVVLLNSSQTALEKLQEAMEGEAERANIYNDEDIVELCKSIRRELYEERYASNG